MNIAIDSSILRRDRKLESFDLLLLKRLAQLNLLQLHIPWIVYQEITSHNLLDANKSIQNMSRDLKIFSNRGVAIKEQIQLKAIAKQLDEIDLQQSILTHWDAFLSESKAILHELDNSHGKSVMTSYFEGKSPFPEPKSRKDIPDAFIFECIKSILVNYSPLVLIADDNNLRKASDKIVGVTAVASVAELYALPEFQPLMAKYKEVESYVDELITLETNLPKLSKAVIRYIHDGLFDQQEIFSEFIPDDENKATIEEVWMIREMELDKANIQYVDSHFYVTVKGTGVFTLEFFLFKADYYNYSERNIRIVDSDWNKHYFLANEDYDFEFSFKCKIDEEDIEKFTDYIIEDINLEVIGISSDHR